jgi:hypothetical protein
MRGTSVRIRATDFPTHRRRRRRDQNSTCCCLGMVIVCALIALAAARKPLAGAVRGLLHREAVKEKPRPEFPLSLSVPQQDWYRYDIVPIQVTLVSADGRPVSSEAPEVVVLDGEGDIVQTVGGLDSVPLRFDAAKGVWQGSWPVPFGAQAGADAVYTVEAKATFAPRDWGWEPPAERRKREKEEAAERREQEAVAKSKGEKAGKAAKTPSSGPQPEGEAVCTATASFRVVRRDRADLPPGTCAVDWEQDFPDGELTRPDGTKGDWRVMFDWAELMGADTLWFRGAVTEVYSERGRLTLENPWNGHNLEMIPEMAQEAHRRGLKLGVWAVAYETYPNRPSQHAVMKKWKPAYRWTQDFSRSRRVPTEEAAVSLLDDGRLKNLAGFLAQMQATEGVDYVGFDYIRSGADWGGYELTDGFARSMPVIGLPGDWGQFGPNERMGWLCDRVDGRQWATNVELYHQWNWYRAHLLSERIRSMVERARLQKPLWTFGLSWWHGEQHGQDPLMFADAGVSIDAVMLYECDTVAQYESMVSQWRDGINEEGGIPPGHINIMVGDQVNFHSHQRLTNPAAPEELYRRITKAASQFTKGQPLWGAFVHDIWRICAPKLAASRGPYSSREWALAGAAAFSTVRANWGVQPIKCALTAPKRAAVGSTITCALTIENTCGAEVKDIAITVMDTSQINRVTKTERVPALGPKQKITVPVQVQITGWNAQRASRYMVAAQLRWPPGEYGKQVRRDLPRLYTVMAYLNAG